MGEFRVVRYVREAEGGRSAELPELQYSTVQYSIFHLPLCSGAEGLR